MKKLGIKFIACISLMVMCATHVWAVVILPKGDPNKYTDIVDHWAESSMRYVIQEGYFKGETETAFLPDNPMSRAMVCTVLWRLTGEDLTHKVDIDGKLKTFPNYVKKFWDMKDDDWYTNYISWANENDIIQGYTEREFRPNEPVSREQLAVILHNYLKNYKLVRNLDVYKINEKITYTDEEQIADWAKEQVETMQQVGLLSGRTDGRFDPKGTVTRAEVATVIERLVAWLNAR